MTVGVSITLMADLEVVDDADGQLRPIVPGCGVVLSTQNSGWVTCARS
jgi:hypothetical protein